MEGEEYPTDIALETTTSNSIPAPPLPNVGLRPATTSSTLSPPPKTSTPLLPKPIFAESKRIYLKRKHSANLVQDHELSRRARISSNERTIQERRRELQSILDSTDAEQAEMLPRKKQRQAKQEVPKLTKKPEDMGNITPIFQGPREAAMRTEIVPMLPCNGYMLPQRNSGSVVYVGEREIRNDSPWMSDDLGKDEEDEFEEEDSILNVEDGSQNDAMV